MSSFMHDFLVDTPLGWLARRLTGGRILVYPEEAAVSGSNVQEQLSRCREQGITRQNEERLCLEAFTPTSGRRANKISLQDAEKPNDVGVQSESERNHHTGVSNDSAGKQIHDFVIVDWESSSDRANPMNWPFSKKLRVYLIINCANAAVYLSSSIYAASQEGIMDEFHVTHTKASLGLALFVLGYGFGPLILSPLADVARIGRNPPYVVSAIIFVILSILAATARDITGLLILRFLQGFFGSPVLSFGGASLSDICNDDWKPIALYTWACSGFAAPSIAPIISGFAVPVMGWRWSLWEIVLANAPALVLLLFLPETSAAKILYCRSRRLSRANPSINYRSIKELKHGKSVGQLLRQSLLVPWQMHALDPSIMFTSIYGGLVYGTYYSFFEVFPLVYQDIYGFSLGASGLPYLSIVVAVVVVGIPYCLYVYHVVNPRAAKGKMTPEQRLIPGLMASFLVPAGLFLFAWTARADIHWIVPTLGVGLTSAGLAIILQSIFVYISLGYPHYAASAFGGNNFVRSLLAFGALLWSRPLYENLGISRGSSLVGGVCVTGIIGIFALFYYGARLRAVSRFAM